MGVEYHVSRDPGDPYADYPRRFSYLIGPDGLVARAYDVTDVAGHAQQVIEDLLEQGAAGST